VYGDVNGDGIVDEQDSNLLSTYLGFDFNYVPALNSVISAGSTVGDPTTFTNGYETYKNPFINGTVISFQIVNPLNDEIIAIGTDGYVVADPNDERLAIFGSFALNFYSLGVDNYTAVGGYKLVMLNSGCQGNNGGFEILGLDNLNNVITIRKIVLNSDTIQQLFRADISGNYEITQQDLTLLQNYVSKYSFTHPDSLSTKIGTSFQVLKFTLEKFEDRADDYYAGDLNSRNSTLHPVQDITLQTDMFLKRRLIF